MASPIHADFAWKRPKQEKMEGTPGSHLAINGNSKLPSDLKQMLVSTPRFFTIIYVIILHAHTRQHHESLQVASQESKVERHKCHMRKFSTLDGFTLVCTDCVMGGVR